MNLKDTYKNTSRHNIISNDKKHTKRVNIINLIIAVRKEKRKDKSKRWMEIGDENKQPC